MQLLIDTLERSEKKRFTSSELARALNVSEQVIHNWTKRGISVDGALQAQLVFGKDANFLLGRLDHPMVLPRPNPGQPDTTAKLACEPEVTYLTNTVRDRQQLELLGLFGQLDRDGKIEALAELRGFVNGRRPRQDGNAPAVAGKK